MRSQCIIDKIEAVRSAVSFDEATHRYTVNGNEFPSVTTVIPRKDFFVSSERLEECRMEGEWKHSLLEAFFLDDDPPPTPFNDALKGFLSTHPEFGEFVGSEVLLWSKFGYAGRADLLFENAVIDMKRTIGEPRYHALQLVAYQRAAVEHDLIYTSKNHYIISIDDDGKLRQKNVYTQGAETMFLVCLRAYNETNEAKRQGFNMLINSYLRSA